MGHRLPGGDRHRGAGPLRQRLLDGRPDRRGGRGQPGRRLPHRELPRDDDRRAGRPARTRRRTRPSARSSTRYVPSSKDWVGIAARSTVLVYNPSKVAEADLPASIMDLADPKYAGQWGAAAGGADFQAIVSAILAEEGAEKTPTWLSALKSNAKIYQNNIATMKAVNAGQSAMGVIYHYYWYRDQALQKASSGNTDAALLQEPGPGRVRQPLRRRRAEDHEARGGRPEVPRVRHEHRRARRSCAPPTSRSTPSARTPQSDPALPPLAALEAPHDRPVHAQRPEGHRADDEGRAALGDPRPATATGPRGPGTVAGAPPAAPGPPRPQRASARAAGRGRARRHALRCCRSSSSSPRRWSPARPRRSTLLWRPRVGELLRNTALPRRPHRHAARRSSASAPPGSSSAPRCPGAGFWRVAFVAPLAVPAFVNSFAWSPLVPGFEGLGGAVIVTTLSYFPFVFLPVAALLRTTRPGLEEAARALGHGPWRTACAGGAGAGPPRAPRWGAARRAAPARRVRGPRDAPLPDLHDGDPRPVRGRLRLPVGQRPRRRPHAPSPPPSSPSSCSLRGRTRHARVGGGAARRAVAGPRSAGRPRSPSLGVGALTILALGVPAWSIGTWLARSREASSRPRLGPAVCSTLVARRSSRPLVTTAATLPAAWLLPRSRSRLALALERVTYLAASLPGVVVALALITLTIAWARPLYQSALVLVLAYVDPLHPARHGLDPGRHRRRATRARRRRPGPRGRTAAHLRARAGCR